MSENKQEQFTHLKIHTQYSICEGALKTSELANICKEKKIKAIGLCDSYNLCGALEFSEALSKAGTQPIIGTQISIKYQKHFGKISLFAKNLEGYKNLISLSSKSFLDVKEDQTPHCTILDIKNNSKGIIILTGSLDGFFGKLFQKNLTDEFVSLMREFKQIYQDNIYLEIQRHNDPGEKNFENYLFQISKKLDLPLIATQEVFYITKDMHEAHDAYICIGEKTYVNEQNRKKYTDEHYLKTSDEMKELFSDIPEALINNINFPFRISYRPTKSLPVLPNIQDNKFTSVDDQLVKGKGRCFIN